MQWRNTIEKYGVISKAFHWVVGVTIIGMIAFGFLMGGYEPPFKYELYDIHKSIGATLILLAVLRIIWRIRDVRVPLVAGLNKGQKLAAKGGHYTLYVLMLAMPLSGWGMSSAGGHAVEVFGLFTLPALVEKDKAIGGFFHDAHEYLAWALIVVISLHVLAALYHHFIRKDETLKRMVK